MKEVKIVDEKDYVKDLDSNAILNSNVEALVAYRKKKKKRLEQDNKIKSLEEKIKSLESLIEKLIK